MAPKGSRVVYMLLTIIVILYQAEGKSREEKRKLKEKSLEMFKHAYNSYMEHAYPADELSPLSCEGQDRTPFNSHIFGNFSLTLIDSLDTLAVLGFVEEFEKAIKLTIKDVSFDSDVDVSVFETNIRVLGGLLGAHVAAVELKKTRDVLLWYKGELLDMAKDIGNRLLPAFNTETGIPSSVVNLRNGISDSWVTSTACAGSFILEFAALSRLTGDPVFEEKAHRVMAFLWERRQLSNDLMGTFIHANTGKWLTDECSVGANGDSYYEYLLKAYVLLGDESYLDRFNRHYSAIMKYINQGPFLLDVYRDSPGETTTSTMQALLAFWPGLQVLKGDISSAVQIHEMFYKASKRHSLLPEQFYTDLSVRTPVHCLRPEFVESTYFLYKATKDSHYLDIGESILNNIQKYSRVACGFAALRDLTTGAHENKMDSFFLAETLKYLYLLFAEPKDLLIDVDNYVFTTEAHILPLALSRHSKPTLAKQVAIFPRNESEEMKKFHKSCINNRMNFQHNYYAYNMRQSPQKSVKRQPSYFLGIVQVLSAPHYGSMWMNAGPALFGTNLGNEPNGVRGSLTVAMPINGCTPLNNTNDVIGRIAIVERGDCRFIDKARNIENAGGIGGIVIDNNLNSTGSTTPFFAMSGEGYINIPSLFLFRQQGDELMETLRQNPQLSVLLAQRVV